MVWFVHDHDLGSLLRADKAGPGGKGRDRGFGNFGFRRMGLGVSGLKREVVVLRMGVCG